MDRTLRIPNRSSRLGKPTWEAIDDYLPVQGEWTEREYLRFDTNRGIELSHARLVFLPWPDAVHQTLLMICCDRLSHCYVDGTRGLSVPRFKLRLASQLWRMPDVVYVLPSNRHRAHSEYFDCADLVIEVVSPDRPKRDLVKKRREYAAAGIPEYWVVDPRYGQRTITFSRCPRVRRNTSRPASMPRALPRRR